MAEAQGATAPPKKKRKMSQKLDKVKLTKATPITPSITVHLHQTGVTKSQVSECKGKDGQNIYRCNIGGCEYITAQFAQACTHIHRKHLRVCVKCQLCDKYSF